MSTLLSNIEGCLACDLLAGRVELPGGLIHRTDFWVVEHCLGPFPVGTLVIKPLRHVLLYADLTEVEAVEYGPLLRDVARTVREITAADQIYVCLWSHKDWVPGHIHFVVQPVWNQQGEQFAAPGPYLQVEMFARDQRPSQEEIDYVAKQARQRLSRS